MRKKIGSKIINIIFAIIIIFIFCKLFELYKTYNYNEFIKAEFNQGITTFTRDKNTTYNYEYSYKIESKDYNDALFYKTINVKPNTPYRLSCMVKTENVVSDNSKNNGGAQLSILNTTETSETISGTSDWQRLEFMFDSKNRETIDIGFRLGGNETNSKGIAWFSDFKLEEGIKDNSTNWKMACFIIKNIDVNINNKDINISMSLSDMEKVKTNMSRFKNSAYLLSNGKMTVDYDIYEINEPLNSITYSEEYGYYLDPSDVNNILKDYLKSEEYDHIFVAAKLGDEYKNIEIPVNDWIGLRWNGFMWYRFF